jgi:hypothetical protein
MTGSGVSSGTNHQVNSKACPKIATQMETRRRTGDAKKSPSCGRHALAKIRLCSRRSEEMGVANGERQIKIAGRGAGVIEEARAD